MCPASCKEEAHVDRGEYQAAKIITCPVAPCKYKWCKLCEQTVQPFGPEHSCDGTNEFNHLFQQEGWKRCPGTPSLTMIQNILHLTYRNAR